MITGIESSHLIFWIAVLINTVIAIAYGVVNLIRRKPMDVAFFFLFLPIIGMLLYFLPILNRRFLDAVGVNREAVLTHAYEIERRPEHPDIEESLRVVPIEDAMAISDNSEKRALLLNQLQKSLEDNYKALLVASEDEDSESAHYIAAAKMEIYRLHQAHWLERRRDYEENPNDPETFHLAFDALNDMLYSGVLSNREQHSYQKRLCELVQSMLDTAEDEVTAEEVEEYLGCLISLERYEDAERLWTQHSQNMNSENAYQYILKMYYQTKDLDGFTSALNDLRGNRDVRLSSNGLEQLRYWTRRLSNPKPDNSKMV